MSTDQCTWRAPSTKVAHRTMREVNSSIVLDILRQGKPVSRVELARRTRLSKPTVSSIVEDLAAAGLVRRIGVAMLQAAFLTSSNMPPWSTQYRTAAGAESSPR